MSAHIQIFFNSQEENDTENCLPVDKLPVNATEDELAKFPLRLIKFKDEGLFDLTYTISKTPQFGNILVENKVLDVGNNFTSRQLLLAKVYYKNFGNESVLDEVTLKIDSKGQEKCLKVS